jgi:hypothetical protein
MQNLSNLPQENQGSFEFIRIHTIFDRSIVVCRCLGIIIAGCPFLLMGQDSSFHVIGHCGAVASQSRPGTPAMMIERQEEFHSIGLFAQCELLSI